MDAKSVNIEDCDYETLAQSFKSWMQRDYKPPDTL